MAETFTRLSLGTFECDSCGTDFDGLDVGHDGHQYAFRLVAGCMGGAQFFDADKARFLERVRAEEDYFIRNFPEHAADFTAMIRAVSEHVPEATEDEDDEDDEMSDEEAAEYGAELVAQLRRDSKEVPRWML
jgi:hypothetical protein